MKYFFIFFLLIAQSVNAQVGINTITPDASAALDVTSIDAGVLIPRMTDAQKTAIGTPATGLLIYQTDDIAGFWYYTGTTWLALDKTPSWDLDGNDGTNSTTHFIGTTDDVDLVFKRNNILAGKIATSNLAIGINTMPNLTTGLVNTAFGNGAMRNITSGSNNLAMGSGALFFNTDGDSNVAIGRNALFFNDGGDDNLAIGNYALEENTSGVDNLAIGLESLGNNTTGVWNLAIGKQALSSNTNGHENLAIGRNVLESNVSGNTNIGIGRSSLIHNVSGDQNIAIGGSSLLSNDIGNDNIAIGTQAIVDNESGENNIGIGHQAIPNNISGEGNIGIGRRSLNLYTSGSFNTGIGYEALEAGSVGSGGGDNNTALGHRAFYSSAAGNQSNSTAIGYNAYIPASNNIRLGNTSVTTIGGYANWTNVSDRRVKKNIREDIVGLDFILKLRPVTYNLDMDALADFNKTPEEYRLKDAELLKSAEVQSGFIAQEVEMAANSVGYNFHGVDVPQNPESHYGLRYAEFVVPIIKGMQEQQVQIENLKSKIETLETQNRQLTLQGQIIASLEKRLNKLEQTKLD